MDDIILCASCLSNGVKNRCYITGYDSKCSHDNGWAYPDNLGGGIRMKCNCCSNKTNRCYITGYDTKCGHNNGYAYVPNSQKNATCFKCGKELSGKWKMETNPRNNSYFETTTGRYLGISDGYFLYGGNPDWVYSYCKPCWIDEIRKQLPNLGITISENVQPLVSELKDLTGKLQKEIDLVSKIKQKDAEIESLKSNIAYLVDQIKTKDNEIDNLKKENNK